jgi:phospholipid/cholesterol/gamma-HCH transport system substrate-binding protein
VNINDVAQLLGLPPTDQICGRLLSGDPNADGVLDDLNHNGVPDLQELLTAIFSPTGGGARPAPVGFPGVGAP